MHQQEYIMKIGPFGTNLGIYEAPPINAAWFWPFTYIKGALLSALILRHESGHWGLHNTENSVLGIQKLWFWHY